MGWVIIVVNAYVLFSFFRSVGTMTDDAAIGITFIMTLFFLAIINVILYVLYRVTGTKKRSCPACGSKVPVGLTVCQKCLFDFRKAASGE